MLTKNEDLKSVQRLVRNQKLPERVAIFKKAIPTKETTYLRTIVSAADREVLVEDRITGGLRRMLMFASNNYLGLANHPHVAKRVKAAIAEYGCGIGGPPLLNGYIKLVEEAEERLAALKGQEAALLFSSGFMANLGVVTGLAQGNDVVLYDELSHASFYDAIKLTKARALQFAHNDLRELESLLQKTMDCTGSVFVCVEGVYSMDGDLAPLDRITALVRKYGAFLIVDDAHGTGVLGEGGCGTASLFNCCEEVDVTMGTFSKVFASCGGFLAGSEDLINYLRFHSRPYIFSASIPPVVTAMVLGGLEVMESEPWLRLRLLDNARYAIEKLQPYGFCSKPEAAIIALKLPEGMDIRAAAWLFHQKNIFINPIEYPAVPADEQRFRISFMATHTKEDIDRLAKAVDEVWNDPEAYFEQE
ncbi:MAG: aminotransferase class I/II-fold pyridoxal phosphate-dependent enzyme [Flavisolibacter sp.]